MVFAVSFREGYIVKTQVVAWNTLLFAMTWWLFGFHTFELLQVGKSSGFFGWEEMFFVFFLGEFWEEWGEPQLLE